MKSESPTHRNFRPIRRDYPRKTNPLRIPEIEPLTPRLRHESIVGAIGFHHDFSEKDDDE